MYTKSVEEYKMRCNRGRATVSRDVSNRGEPCRDQTDENFLNIYNYEPVIDDSAWRFLKERVPKYAKFEENIENRSMN